MSVGGVIAEVDGAPELHLLGGVVGLVGEDDQRGVLLIGLAGGGDADLPDGIHADKHLGDAEDDGELLGGDGAGVPAGTDDNAGVLHAVGDGGVLADGGKAGEGQREGDGARRGVGELGGLVLDAGNEVCGDVGGGVGLEEGVGGELLDLVVEGAFCHAGHGELGEVLGGVAGDLVVAHLVAGEDLLAGEGDGFRAEGVCGDGSEGGGGSSVLGGDVGLVLLVVHGAGLLGALQVGEDGVNEVAGEGHRHVFEVCASDSGHDGFSLVVLQVALVGVAMGGLQLDEAAVPFLLGQPSGDGGDEGAPVL